MNDNSSSLPRPEETMQHLALLHTATREQAEVVLRRLGEITRIINAEDMGAAAATDAVRQARDDAVKPLQLEHARLVELLRQWANARRSELTSGGKTKCVPLPDGVISWRKRSSWIVFTTKAAEIVERIKAAKLPAFLRTRQELNRSAMLKDPARARRMPGVVIEPGAEK